MKKEKSPKNKVPKKYQDCVIRDGKLVGDWECLYENFEDPWNQSHIDQIYDSRRILALSWCNRIREQYKVTRVLELGCGFGHLTNSLNQHDFSAIGADISKTAIAKARAVHPSSTYVECALSDFETISLFDADIYIMAEITWYVLDDLDKFLHFLKLKREAKNNPVFLIHLLTTYAPGIQKYGADKFTDLQGILKYFNLKYLEWGFVKTFRADGEGGQGTYFVAEI